MTQRQRLCDAEHIAPEHATACTREVTARFPSLRSSRNRIAGGNHYDGELMVVFGNLEDLDQNVPSAA